MKITKSHLAKLIKEEMGKIREYGMHVSADGKMMHPDEDGNPDMGPSSDLADIIAEEERRLIHFGENETESEKWIALMNFQSAYGLN